MRFIRRGSLRLRLVGAAAALIVLALVLAGAGLLVIFERELAARATDDLDRTAKFIAAQLEPGPEGRPRLLQEPADLRLATAYGGLYWQVEGGGTLLRSRSLWDAQLQPPAFPPGVVQGAEPEVLTLAGPERSRLLAVRRAVALGRRGAEVDYAILVAIDRRDLAASRDSFLAMLVPSLAGLGLVLVLAMAAFVHRAMLPFRALGRDLRAVEAGQRATLSGAVPDEVRPVVEALNRLVTLQERAVGRARMQAGDMAHGLKTPLAVLGALARRLRAENRAAEAAEVEEQVQAMARQVDRALARARAGGGAALRRHGTPVRPLAHKLVSVLQRLPADRAIDWRLEVAPDFTFPAEEGDLTEMLGNVLDNARKWAGGVVRLATEGGALVVEDDGPGLAPDLADSITRGQRWDESRPGTGFGLAITRDLLEGSGGALQLQRAASGGLRVLLQPAAGA
ncbi:sensor histidine kinase [Teichococcus deserti]|uniref:sensor histidine kinase n=1 Tax=Teichococcus deserti TaxID=1817963 RepID=UPI001F618A74|nr:sensor histidine kinase [Pseudoroseomonas deserti]